MPKLSQIGRLDSSLRGWIYTYARQNYWRVAHVNELEDLIQDGFLVYAKCRQRYAATVVNQRHFMALFKTAYTRHVHDLARQRTRGYEEATDFSSPEATWIDRILGMSHNGGPVAVLMNEARFPVKAVIQLFTTESGSTVVREFPRAPYESLNNYLCRLIGVPHDAYNLPELVKSFIRGTGMYYLRQPV
jgi:hypothetical protein